MYEGSSTMDKTGKPNTDRGKRESGSRSRGLSLYKHSLISDPIIELSIELRDAVTAEGAKDWIAGVSQFDWYRPRHNLVSSFCPSLRVS
jgi:hypothetical protein